MLKKPKVYKPKFPGNESTEHFMLKNIATILLKQNYGCQNIATEVRLPFQCLLSDKMKGKKKVITDALGTQIAYKGSQPKYMIRNIEAKASVSDFNNGHSIIPGYNYVITPKGLLNKDDLLDFVGLIEVDFDSFYWGRKIQGVEVVKNPSIYMKDEIRKNYYERLKERINKRNTNIVIYKNPFLRKGETLW